MKTLKYETTSEVVRHHPAISDVLVYDIETDSLDTDTAKCVFFGAYSYKHGKYFIFNRDELSAAQQLIDEHKVLVGFNNKNFDGPIISNINNKMDITYKIVFDCMTVLYDFNRRKPNKEPIIRVNGKSLESQLPDRKLKTIARVLGFPIEKGEIDYKIFQKTEWTEEELKQIHTYLFKDVEITRMLFEFYVEYFDMFKEYVDDENVRKFNYIRSSLGSYAYSALCYLADIEPLFEDDLFKLQQRPLNAGGFVLEPQVPYAEGTVICADYSSLYPHIFFMCNLFNPINNGQTDDGWNGGTLFPDLQTSYKCDKLGKIETILKSIYMKRREYKKNKDPREVALKVMINTIYGLTGSPIFKQVFNMTTSGDCTYIGRTMINYTRKEFENAGYNVVYGDTDSIFIVLPEGKTIEDFEIIAKETINKILSSVPFPAETFKLEIDDIFKRVWLFGKKNYVGINKDHKLIIKGLPIIKHNASQLGMKILEKIKPLIIEKDTIKFPKQYFEKIIDEEIAKDISIIGQLYNVRSPDSYKSTSSIQCQIAEKFGEGSHILIPNKCLGEVGKQKKYCTPEEAKSLSFSDLFLDKVWSELEPFIE